MKLHFLGAAQKVTGSSYMLEAGPLRTLVDCGMLCRIDRLAARALFVGAV